MGIFKGITLFLGRLTGLLMRKELETAAGGNMVSKKKREPRKRNPV